MNGFWEVLVDWPTGTIMTIIFLVVCLVIVVLAACALFEAADSWFLPRNRKMGRVVSKTFAPEEVEGFVPFHPGSAISIPRAIDRPADWSVSVDVDGQQDSVSVTEEFFESLSENDPIRVEYVIGRFSGDLYIKALSHA